MKAQETKLDRSVRKRRNRQCEEILRLPARDVASALTFAWGYLQAIEENEERDINERGCGPVCAECDCSQAVVSKALESEGK